MVVILMGVSGSGKTTLGMRLAGSLGWAFIDAEDLHSTRALEKTAMGERLTDTDVETSMSAVRAQVTDIVSKRDNAVLACSALTNEYRRHVTVDPAAVRFVYLKGTASLVRQRLRSRSGHFSRENLLANQFAALEEPAAADAVTIDIDERPGRIVEQIRQALAL